MIIGPTAYAAGDCSHSTFAIWRELAKGFSRLNVFARAKGAGALWDRDGVTVHLIRGFRRREFEFLCTQFALVPLGCRLRPDVIVSQSPPLGGLAALAISNLTGAGTLIEIHGAEYVESGGKFTRRSLLQFLSGIVLRRAKLIRVLSESMGRRVVDRYGAEIASRIRVLPPRVDLTRFAPVTRSKPQDRLSVAMVGALNDNKGQLRLARVLAAADMPVDLHLAGDGPLRNDCDDLAGKTGADSKFRLFVHGSLPPDRVASLLGAADIFVMYSRSEGMPRAIMEAMATGLPVVTTRAGFCSDVIEHNVEGFLLGEDPDREILLTLNEILRDPSILIPMGASARKRVTRDFDAAKIYPRYQALIAEAARQ